MADVSPPVVPSPPVSLSPMAPSPMPPSPLDVAMPPHAARQGKVSPGPWMRTGTGDIRDLMDNVEILRGAGGSCVTFGREIVCLSTSGRVRASEVLW